MTVSEELQSKLDQTKRENNVLAAAMAQAQGDLSRLARREEELTQRLDREGDTHDSSKALHHKENLGDKLAAQLVLDDARQASGLAALLADERHAEQLSNLDLEHSTEQSREHSEHAAQLSKLRSALKQSTEHNTKLELNIL